MGGVAVIGRVLIRGPPGRRRFGGAAAIGRVLITGYPWPVALERRCGARARFNQGGTRERCALKYQAAARGSKLVTKRASFWHLNGLFLPLKAVFSTRRRPFAAVGRASEMHRSRWILSWRNTLTMIVTTNAGPATWIFPRKFAIYKVRAPNSTLLDTDSTSGSTVGVAGMFGVRNRPFQ